MLAPLPVDLDLTSVAVPTLLFERFEDRGHERRHAVINVADGANVHVRSILTFFHCSILKPLIMPDR